jgi:hypothetical protein
MTKNRFLQEFFARYPGFEYNSTNPATGEFRRLCKMFRWDIDSRNQAREAFQIALVKEFNGIYGINEHDLGSLQGLCRVLGIAPVPGSTDDCRKVCRLIFLSADPA